MTNADMAAVEHGNLDPAVLRQPAPNQIMERIKEYKLDRPNHKDWNGDLIHEAAQIYKDKLASKRRWYSFLFDRTHSDDAVVDL
jgi:hypothetical protein